MFLDIKKWFLDEDNQYLDPHDDEAAEKIEESILESIYGDEDHDDDDDEEEEEDETNKDQSEENQDVE